MRRLERELLHARICELYSKGLTQTQIAMRLSIRQRYVWDVLEQRGVPHRAKAQPIDHLGSMTGGSIRHTPAAMNPGGAW
jgi:hypothetical protein